jgi:hypothetical protein
MYGYAKKGMDDLFFDQGIPLIFIKSILNGIS